MEQTEKLKQRHIPQPVDQLCVDWDAYAHDHVVDEIDSGLKERKIGEAMMGGLMPESPKWMKRQ